MATEVSPEWAFAKGVVAQVSILSGEMSSIGFAYLRSLVGINTVSGARRLERRQLQGCVLPSSGPNYAPLALNVGQVIQMVHCSPPAAAAATWGWARQVLGWQGIDLGGAGGNAGSQSANDWSSYVELQASAAPMERFLSNYHRTRNGPGATALAADASLQYALRRGGYSRADDREAITQPWHTWGGDVSARLHWMGLVTDADYNALLAQSGYVRPDDLGYAKQLARVLPAPIELMAWQSRQLWDDGIASLYGLDGMGQGADVSRFFAVAQGLGAAQLPLPGQPAGNTDWLGLAYRASRSLPSFGESVAMQHRLRPVSAGGPDSVVPGIPSWTVDDTRNMLRAKGFPDPVIDRMVGLSVEPVSTRIINEVLFEALRHPNVAAVVQAAMPVGVDWVLSAYLDHGYSLPVATMAAAGIRARAQDEQDAEMIASAKQLRAEKRAAAMRQYDLGTMTAADALLNYTDQWYDSNMAAAQIAVQDENRKAGIIERQLHAVRETFLRGSLSIPQTAAALSALSVIPGRVQDYLTEWGWERTEAVRTLSTGQVLAALKEGFITDSVALARLVNLGWNGADALVQVAAIDKEVALAQAKAAGQAAEKAIALAAKQKAEAATLAKEQAAQLAKLAKEQAHANEVTATALHEQLMHHDKYYAAAFGTNAAYAAAVKAKDLDKQNAAVHKSLVEYQTYLLDQLRQAASEGQYVKAVNIIDTTAAPQPGTPGTAPIIAPPPGGATGKP